MKFFFYVSLVGGVFFKNYFTTGFWGWVNFFSSLPLAAKLFFFTPQVSEVFFFFSLNSG